MAAAHQVRPVAEFDADHVTGGDRGRGCPDPVHQEAGELLELVRIGGQVEGGQEAGNLVGELPGSEAVRARQGHRGGLVVGDPFSDPGDLDLGPEGGQEGPE